MYIVDNVALREGGREKSSQTAESFFKNVYSSFPKAFQRPEWLTDPPAPAYEFDDELIVPEEVLHVIKNTKSLSSPSPIDQVTYRVLKKCPSLLATLTELYNSCWLSTTVPTSWKQGIVRLIPKEAALSINLKSLEISGQLPSPLVWVRCSHQT